MQRRLTELLPCSVVPCESVDLDRQMRFEPAWRPAPFTFLTSARRDWVSVGVPLCERGNPPGFVAVRPLRSRLWHLEGVCVYQGIVRGSPKCGSGLATGNRVIREMWLLSSVRTNSESARPTSACGSLA